MSKGKVAPCEPPSPMKSSRRLRGLGSSQELDLDELIDRVSQGVLDRLNDSVSAAVQKSIQPAISEIRAAFEDRMRAVESTCQEIVTSLEFTEGKLQEENASLKVRICELEYSMYRQEHEANFILSGVTEDPAKEDTQSVVIKLCKETLDLDVKEEEIVTAVRLGRSTNLSNNHEGNDGNGRVRPRPILVKTTGKSVKSRVMARRMSHLRSTSIFLNDDLSRHEQNARRALVPVFKDL